MEKTQPLCQFVNRETVALVVHDFYRHLLAEPKLVVYFAHISDWPEHESHITDFWWGLMGGKVEQPRPRAMERGHQDLVFGSQELTLWLKLFEKTLQQHLPAEVAERWSMLATRLGQMMGERGLAMSR